MGGRTKLSRRRKLALAAALTFGGGGAILLAIEIALRAAGVEPHGYVVVDDATCYLAWGENTHDETEKRAPALVHRVWTDEHGFRTKDGKTKTGAKCRVLAVGDSFAHGQFVEADEAFPAVVERAARERGYSVEVDNGGMPGHTIAEERVAVLGRWKHLPSRAVIVSHTANDLEDLVVLQRLGCRIDGPPPTELRPALAGATRGLRVIRAGQSVAVRAGALSPRMRILRHGSPELRQPATAAECAAAERAYLDLSLDLTGALAAAGTKVMFAFVEGFFCAGTTRSDFQAEFGRRLGEAGAQVVDVRSALSEPDASLRPADSHPSATGHQRIGSQIGAALFASGWLEGCQ